MLLDYPAPPLADDVVALRPWSAGDLPTVAEASRDPYIPKVTTVPAPFSPDAGRRWLQRQLGRQAGGTGISLAIVAAERGAAVGGILLIARRPGWYGLGYWLVRSARRRGLASRAVALLAPWTLAQPGVSGVEALVEPWNEASAKVVERAGFVRDRVLRGEIAAGGRRADVVRYVLDSSVE